MTHTNLSVFTPSGRFQGQDYSSHMGSYSPQPSSHQRQTTDESFHGTVGSSVPTPSPESNWQHNNELSPHSNTSSSGVSSSSTAVNGTTSHPSSSLPNNMTSHGMHPALHHSPHSHVHHHHHQHNHHPSHLHPHHPYPGLHPSSGRDVLHGLTHLSPIPGQMLSPHHLLNHTGDGKPVIQAAQLAGNVSETIVILREKKYFLLIYTVFSIVLKCEQEADRFSCGSFCWNF